MSNETKKMQKHMNHKENIRIKKMDGQTKKQTKGNVGRQKSFPLRKCEKKIK